MLDILSNGKITWGGYNEEITNNAAKSELNGAVNTKAIVAGVVNNSGFDNKPYAVMLCAEAINGGRDDWYLPSINEADMISLLKKNSM